jgi:hypothetical protein
MFRKLFGLVFQGRRGRRPVPPGRKVVPPRPGRPRLEALEPRYAPSCTVNVINRVLTVQCDGNPNTVTADEVTNELGQFTVINGQPFYTSTHDSIVIYGGSGGLTTNILAVVRPLTLFGGHDFDAVNIGDLNHPLQRIQSPLDIENPPEYNVVTIDDRADGAFRTGTIDVIAPIQFTSYERVRVQGAAEMDFKVADTRSVTLRTGRGGSLINVLATAAFYGGQGTTVEGNTPFPQPPNDTVNVGSGNTYASILGPLAITNLPNWTHVNINDGSDNADHNGQGLNPPIMVLTATSLTGLSPGAISFGPNDLASLAINVGNGNNIYTIDNTQASTVPGGNLTTLNTGAGNDIINVEGTAAGTATTVNTGNGDNTVNLSPTAQNLTTLAGSLAVNFGLSTNNVLNLYDNAAPPTPADYTVTDTGATASTAPFLNLTYAFAANAGAVDIWADPGSLPVNNLTSAITCLFNGSPC